MWYDIFTLASVSPENFFNELSGKNDSWNDHFAKESISCQKKSTPTKQQNQTNDAKKHPYCLSSKHFYRYEPRFSQSKLSKLQEQTEVR